MKKPTATNQKSEKAMKLISLNNPVVRDLNVDVDLPKKYTSVQLKQMIDAAGGTYKFVQTYLTLSAAKTIDVNKGYLTAVGCNSFFPTEPVIDFPFGSSDFSGKVEVWLTNVKNGDSFTVQFRVSVGFAPGKSGEWRIGSSDTQSHFVAMVPVYQSIDFYIPPITSGMNMSLITLESKFNSDGMWTFKDVIVTKLQ
ncbi:MAG: hypothetical protein IPO83_18805 [Chitinophagaceae bacterium]|nr:hypothetical protein [Chitinophagaceae bacterium]